MVLISPNYSTKGVVLTIKMIGINLEMVEYHALPSIFEFPFIYFVKNDMTGAGFFNAAVRATIRETPPPTAG